VYLVNHAAGTDADAPGWAAGELLATRGPRVEGETPYCVDDALLVNSVDFRELLLSNAQYFDRVIHES